MSGHVWKSGNVWISRHVLICLDMSNLLEVLEVLVEERAGPEVGHPDVPLEDVVRHGVRHDLDGFPGRRMVREMAR